MRIHLFAAACVAALAVSGTGWAAGLSDHVVIVSVDGFRPEFYRDTGWPAPMMQQMAREGAYAERVRGVFPTVTYPSHTTLITGVMPARHGVYFNLPFEEGGQTGRWYWEEKAIRVPTLWDLVREHGGKTVGVSWPVTVGAPIDYLIPEVWSLEKEGDRLQPVRDSARPANLLEELEREAIGKLGYRTYSADYLTRDDTNAAAAAYLLETYQPTLMAVHLIGTDHFMHQVGRDGPLVRRAVASADRGIGAIVEASQRAGIADRTTFLIVGDHGFVNTQTTVAPNVWLAEAGLMVPQADRGDWRATFHTAGGAAFLRLRDPSDSEVLSKVREILSNVPTGIRKLFRIVEREEMDAIGADPHAPFALAASLGVRFSARPTGQAVGPASGGQHGYFPSDFPEIYTGFVAWGAGIKPGVVMHEIGLEDVAPLVSRLLDLPALDSDGVAPLGILAPDAE